VNDEHQEQAQRVDQDVALAARDLLAGVKPLGPPLSLLRTDWLSTTPALGEASLPACSRALMCSVAWRVSHVPSSQRRRK
jgi:hypothetical protein